MANTLIRPEDSRKDPGQPRERRRSPLVAGLIMIFVGAMLLSVNLGYGMPWQMWQYYPVLLIVLGAIGLAMPGRHLSRSGGIWLLATGIYCGVSQRYLFGLSWGSAWPIFIVAYGFEVMFGMRRRDRRVDHHEVG